MKELKIGNFDDADTKSDYSTHQEEANTLRIDKLSNRVTIISIIIPCIIGAILIFGYRDMQETVIDANNEKQSKVLEVTQQFGEKTNALDVELAKMRSLLEKTIPEINKKITKIEAGLAEFSAKKAEKKKTEQDINWIKTKIDQVVKSEKDYKTFTTASNNRFTTDIAKLAKLLKKESDKMEEYENMVATTLKNLSILEKKYDEFKKNSLTRKIVNAKLDKMDKAFNKKLSQLEQRVSKSKNYRPLSNKTKITPEANDTVEPKGKEIKSKAIVEESIKE